MGAVFVRSYTLTGVSPRDTLYKVTSPGPALHPQGGSSSLTARPAP